MPPRKRRSRLPLQAYPGPDARAAAQKGTPDPVPEKAPASAPAPALRVLGPFLAREAVEDPPLVCLDPRTGRATHAMGADGVILARRPGDDWRGRLQAMWCPAGACPSCAKPRLLLMAFAGEAAVCDLLEFVTVLGRQGACTCSYAPGEETPHAAV